MTGITEQSENVTPGELEFQRRMTVSVKVEYFDNINKKIIFDKNFQSFETYLIDDGQQGRDEAVSAAIDKLSEDILLAVVSGW